VPTYPPKPDDVEDVLCPFRRIPIPWSLEKVWCIASGGADEPGRLWAGTIPGGLFRSDDGGASWELVRSLWDLPERAKWAGGGYDYPGIHSICVDPRDSRVVIVAISCGGCWMTRDGGESWEIRSQGMRAEYAPPDMAYDPVAQDPHVMVQCISNPDVLWVQHHNGIFKTTNQGEKWEEITDVRPSVFGFVVTVHPNNPEVAWFVPAQKDEVRVPVEGRVVVTRTRDGGGSFEVLSNGLPQKDAYDLTFRHAMDVGDEGNQLAFGSTTGSLWVSENQGEDWETINEHLPPVYCVRWG